MLHQIKIGSSGKSKTKETFKVKKTTIEKAEKNEISRKETNIDKWTKITQKKMNDTKKVTTSSGKNKKSSLVRKYCAKWEEKVNNLW